MSYFDNLTSTMAGANKKALKHKGVAAWANVKEKTQTRYAPRGKMARRLLQWQNAEICKDLAKQIGLLEEYCSAKGINIKESNQ